MIVARALRKSFDDFEAVKDLVDGLNDVLGAGTYDFIDTGTIGTDAVAKATDGHTIGVSINAPLSTAKALYPTLPYDPAKDLAPVSLLVARYRTAGPRRAPLEECEAALEQIEGVYDIDSLRKLRDLESEVGAAYK